MARRLTGFVAAVAGVCFAAACDQAPPSAPQDSPSFGRGASPNACVFTGNPSLSNSAGSYFQTNDDRKSASGWISAMQEGYEATGPGGARDAGYSLLALTGAASRDASRAGSIDIGETMVKQAINCMYDTKNPPDPTDFTGWPDDDQYDFSAALDAPAGGAFFVRGKTGVDSDLLPAIGNLSSFNSGTDPAGGNVSAIAPAPGKTWPQVLSNKRTLIYGNPVTDGFDWKLIGRNTTFTPFAIVALCQAVHPGEDFDDEAMVFQESVGSLGFQQETAALCGTDPSTLSLGFGGHGGFALLKRLFVAADRMLSPEPLHAAVLATRTIGGSASGAKADEFTVLNLPTVNLRFTVQPPRRPRVSERFPITVDVTTPAGDPAGGITVTLGTTTNNGTGTAIYEITSAAPSAYNGCSLGDNPASGAPWVVTPSKTTLGTVGPDGTSRSTTAHWDKLCFTKPGKLQTVATSQAAGNTAAGNGTKLSSSSNVDP